MTLITLVNIVHMATTPTSIDHHANKFVNMRLGKPGWHNPSYLNRLKFNSFEWWMLNCKKSKTIGSSISLPSPQYNHDHYRQICALFWLKFISMSPSTILIAIMYGFGLHSIRAISLTNLLVCLSRCWIVHVDLVQGRSDL